MSFLISYPSISSHYVNFFLDESWQIVIDHFSQTKQGMFRPPNGDTFSSVLTFDISGSESPPKESGRQPLVGHKSTKISSLSFALMVIPIKQRCSLQWSLNQTWSNGHPPDLQMQTNLDVLVTDHCHWVGIVCIKLGWDFYVFCGLS